MSNAVADPGTNPAATRAADIVIRDLAKQYGEGPAAVQALAGVDLTIESGEFVCLVGASGCGKSTLLRMLAGFESHSGGELLVGGIPVAGPGPDRGVVFQDYGLFPWMSVRENVAYGPRQRGLGRAESNTQADKYIRAVQLERFADQYPHQLSGGMQQRVAIARVLANNPAVMLMDEPFGALDALTRTTLQHELARIQRAEGTTVIFVTHSIEEAVYLSDRVVVMAGGASHGVPGHVRDVVDIDLGSDRDVTSVAFNDLERRIAAMVHESIH
ncbi:ABC transporter ATP-binding protein [Prescottella equi]|uniref:ABC transporter ATP-binding protein n=1 Tax=Rhodococcus hoagii TaxID=43767 RepID=UPI0007CD9A8F|nr:ABC transporter ATP-binding protein [Prescottella equi]